MVHNHGPIGPAESLPPQPVAAGAVTDNAYLQAGPYAFAAVDGLDDNAARAEMAEKESQLDDELAAMKARMGID